MLLRNETQVGKGTYNNGCTRKEESGIILIGAGIWKLRRGGRILNMCFLLLKCSKGTSGQNDLNNNNNTASSRALTCTDVT